MKLKNLLQLIADIGVSHVEIYDIKNGIFREITEILGYYENLDEDIIYSDYMIYDTNYKPLFKLDY